MLQQLWSYFETTGDIKMYLGFKEYEQVYNRKMEVPDQTMNKNEVG